MGFEPLSRWRGGSTAWRMLRRRRQGRHRPGHVLSSAAPEDRDLVTALVDGPVAIEAFRYCDGRTARAVRCDQALTRQVWARPRAEALVAGRVGRRELDDAQPVPTVGHVGEEAGVCH